MKTNCSWCLSTKIHKKYFDKISNYTVIVNRYIHLFYQGGIKKRQKTAMEATTGASTDFVSNNPLSFSKNYEVTKAKPVY